MDIPKLHPDEAPRKVEERHHGRSTQRRTLCNGAEFWDKHRRVADEDAEPHDIPGENESATGDSTRQWPGRGEWRSSRRPGEETTGLDYKLWLSIQVLEKARMTLADHREVTKKANQERSHLLLQHASRLASIRKKPTQYSRDNLHYGTKSPTSLTASDITCLLPCAEEEFADGRQPRYRAALEDTPPAHDDERDTIA
ncbi:hypothetical protein SODALDRAFT_378195 [Sodiomyces alkalinus F11]|uniref:Uncharacterized protein n=1 Tax=Sodiomyces alkalinus (strain CBS 110278 / VKM F-3762 / F11) TaxID=1314773 RepID=A0A3N2PXK2_SODAK|nr:hypothetical protein SODALDRAFT_378195 [Sodiomyces alkalinus F11]ROT39075.1 hypothetical protein SODALDRAFT_378195 [Sodiomyces alkalinus F11]